MNVKWSWFEFSRIGFLVFSAGFTGEFLSSANANYLWAGALCLILYLLIRRRKKP